MKVIVAGSRSITNRRTVSDAIHASGFEVKELVSGMAPGVDTVAFEWALDQNLRVMSMPANWAAYPRGAGRHRNLAMAQYADALVAVWDGKSSGTKHMIETARRMGLQVYVEIVK